MIRWLLRALSALISLPILYFCAALVGAVLPGQHPQIEGSATTRIALARGPIHYDILLPLTEAVRTSFAFAEPNGVPLSNPNARFLIVGWGSTGFYTTTGTYADLTFRKIWDAATGDTAAIHLDVAGDLTNIPDLIWLDITTGQLAILTQTITNSLTLDSAGTPIPLNAHYNQTDAFFAANGPFHLFHTCNAWVGETLRAAGIPFGLWTPTPQAVTLSAWWFSPDPP